MTHMAVSGKLNKSTRQKTIVNQTKEQKRKMSKSYLLIALATFCCTTLSSCFKEEPLNSECDIEQAYLHTDNPGDIFMQPTDSIVNVTSVQTLVTLNVLKGTDLSALAPQFRITPGATITPASGSVQDFSPTGEKDAAGNDIFKTVNYTVTSEDGAYQRHYTVGVRYYPLAMAEYNFENSFLETSRHKYYEWSDYGDGEQPNWATGNGGFAIARPSAKSAEYPTTPLDEGYEGKGICLRTSDTGPFGLMVNMRIAAGNLFTGVFDSKIATRQPLQATHFGAGNTNKIYARPIHFSGYYQYTPGATFQDKDGNAVAGRTDQGDIYAVAYKNTRIVHNDATGADEEQEFYLTGDDVLSSPQIVALARVPNVVKTEGGWQRFDIDFTGDLGFEHIPDFDPALLAKGGYNIAVVFTSSIKGADFEGAIGSTLLIDNVRIAFQQ